MKTYRIILKSGSLVVVKAQEQTMGENDRVLYLWQDDKVVAAFNMNEIVGCVQADNIEE